MKEQDWLRRKAEEHYDLPLRYEPGKGWVDRNGKPVKTRRWGDIRRTIPNLPER